MRAILICPVERPQVSAIFGDEPLYNLPFFGQTLVDHWISFLAAHAYKRVLLLSHYRPDEPFTLSGDGTRWGIEIEVLAESRELTPAEALLKYGETTLDTPAAAEHIFVLDHFPGQPHLPLFTDCSSFFKALQARLPQALSPDRVGYREIAPGICVGRRTSIAATARLIAPCWVGASVSVEADAVIGPHACVEDGSVVEKGARVRGSYVAPETFVGPYTEVQNSLVWENRLADCDTGSVVAVPDAFLLCALRKRSRRHGQSWLARAAELCSRTTESLMVWKPLVIKREG